MANSPVKYDWLAIRAMYEAGESMSSIARKPNMPCKQTISTRAGREGWTPTDRPDESLEVIPFDGLTDTQRIVVTEMAKGLPQRHAAAIAGVTEHTVSEWKKNPKFLNACHAAIAVMARSQLAKVAESQDWRSGLAMLERHPATRDEFAPANSQRGMTGTTFNVLGHVSVGIDRDTDIRLPALGDKSPVIDVGGDSQ